MTRRSRAHGSHQGKSISGNRSARKLAMGLACVRSVTEPAWQEHGQCSESSRSRKEPDHRGF